MGSLLFKKGETQPKEELRPPMALIQNPVPQPQQPRTRKISTTIPQQPKTIFKDISLNKRTALKKSPILQQLVHSDRWHVNPEIIQHLRILNAFQLISTSCAQVLQVQLHTQILFPSPQNIQSIEQQYSAIYASIFHINFLHLRKLNIRATKKVTIDQMSYSLEVLQYLNAPALEELHADGHNMTSVRFLRKCNWKELRTLSLRDTKIADSRHFADVLPYLVNSQHIQILNLASQMSVNWFEVSWIVKMGYRNASQQRIRMDSDDDYFSRNEDRVLRRVEFGLMSKTTLRGKHLKMISAKFNNTYFDNPLALY